MASITNARAQAQLLSIKNAADAGSAEAYINVYNGTVPANLDTALSGNTLLATLTMADPSFADPTDAGGSATMAAGVIADETAAIADGTPTFARIFDSDGTVVVQVTAGVGSGELNFSAPIVALATVSITSLTLTQSE